jgi:hypothetical protein
MNKVYIIVVASWLVGMVVFGLLDWTLLVINLAIIEQLTGLFSGAIKDFREWNVARKSANLTK